MSRPLHPGAVVCSAVLDLRRSPDHASEMRSQLLLGETVRVLGSAAGGRWWRVRNDADGYLGWVRAWGLTAASRQRVEGWRRLASARVAAPLVRATSRPGAGLMVSPLHWNSRVIPGRRRAASRQGELPDGRRGWVPASALAAPGSATPGLAERVESLIGVPYLWGGRCSASFDCSGLVQQVMAERGVMLPRDAHQQHRATRGLAEGSRIEPGDLLFFAPPGERVAHVGLALGGGYFAHARGWVRIGSMDPLNPLHDKELALQFVGARRPRGQPVPRRGRKPA
jgi:gamma-D-glutamyl-L-lysine dipeptidyl-peptidase